MNIAMCKPFRGDMIGKAAKLISNVNHLER
jgi:hypothetical protein